MLVVVDIGGKYKGGWGVNFCKVDFSLFRRSQDCNQIGSQVTVGIVFNTWNIQHGLHMFSIEFGSQQFC